MNKAIKERIQWFPILLEAFFVVLGVVLALAANQWREHNQRQQHAALALRSIRNELEANRQAVDEALAYHVQISEALRGLLRQTAENGTAEEPVYPENRLFSRGYIAPATLLSTAWEAANATDAVTDMSYEDVLMLSKIYQEQSRYAQQAQQAGQLIYAKLFNEGHQGVLRNYANMTAVLAAFWYRECALLESYGQTLAVFSEATSTDGEGLPDSCRSMLRR